MFWKDKDVVVLQCGSFNPPHYLHGRLFEMARNALVAQGANVVGGVMSPVSSAYGKDGLSGAEHRIEMCRRACADSEWVEMDPWEALHTEYVRVLYVLKHVKEKKSAELGKDVLVALVCGADMFQSMNKPNCWIDWQLEEIFRDYGVLVIERGDIDLKEVIAQRKCMTDNVDHILCIPPTCSNDISSSGIRRSVCRKESVKYLLWDSVIEYVAEKGLYMDEE